MTITDAQRLHEVARSGLMDSGPEERFDRLTRLVKASLGVPVALLSIVDDSRQFFKSCTGLQEPWASDRETPLTHSFCQHVVSTEALLSVVDARQHPMVRDSLAIRDLEVIAYLGVPIRSPSGIVIGSLCGIDSKPRQWTLQDQSTLQDLGALVEDQLGMSISERRLKDILNTMPQMVWSTLPDGSHDFYNDRWYEFTGVPVGSTDGEGWNEMFHPDDRDRAWKVWRHSLATGAPYEIEYRLRHKSGVYRWTLGRALPIRDAQDRIERWFGTCTDIHALKEAEEARDLIGRELLHRIKNIFAAVAGLVAITARAEPVAQPFARNLTQRIGALSRAHRYVGSAYGPEELDRTILRLVGSVLAPYQSGDRVVIQGDDVHLSADRATPLALIVHELATNSLKYGALSVESGRLQVSVVQSTQDLELVWSETGGQATAPSTCGFGTRLVSSMCTQLGATIARAWQPDGLKLTLSFPNVP